MVISICTPYWDRQPELNRMFDMYACLYPDLPLEFSVCDDGSPVPAYVPLDWFPMEPWVSYCVLTRLSKKDGPLNPCTPINHAVATSIGDVIVLTTPEMEHQGPILKEMLSLLQDDMDYVSARCIHTPGDIWLTGPESDRNPLRGRLPSPPGGCFQFLTMLRRSLWEKAGGFDEDYRHGQACDDNDWLWRLYEVGAQFKVTTGVAVHSRPNNKRLAWGIPHNRELFDRKWPEQRRRAVVEQRAKG